MSAIEQIEEIDGMLANLDEMRATYNRICEQFNLPKDPEELLRSLPPAMKAEVETELAREEGHRSVAEAPSPRPARRRRNRQMI